MADEIYYGMGQYRHSGSSYINSIDGTITLKYIPSINRDNYRDLMIKIPTINTEENANTSYLLKLDIPQDKVYNISAYLKLMHYKTENGQEKLETNKYQYIQKIFIPKEENIDSSNIILYKILDDNEDKVYAGIVRNDSSDCEIYDIIIENNNYKYKTNENTFLPINQYVETTLAHSFESGAGKKAVSYSFIFTPKNEDLTNINAILLEIVRDYATEDDIIYTVDGKSYRGLYIDKDAQDDEEQPLFKVELYSITELLNQNIINHNPLSHIGVWGHPNLGLNINGEEIHIGQSGFYELDDYDITSLGVAATANDKFIIDYQYKIGT